MSPAKRSDPPNQQHENTVYWSSGKRYEDATRYNPRDQILNLDAGPIVPILASRFAVVFVALLGKALHVRHGNAIRVEVARIVQESDCMHVRVKHGVKEKELEHGFRLQPKGDPEGQPRHTNQNCKPVERKRPAFAPAWGFVRESAVEAAQALPLSRAKIRTEILDRVVEQTSKVADGGGKDKDDSWCVCVCVCVCV